MSGLASAVSVGGSVIGAGTKIYGAMTEGQQAQDYYSGQSALTQRSKAEASRAIQMQIREADLVHDQAEITLQDAEYLKQIGKVKERKFQKETDKGVSTIFSRMAKSGVAMDFGSPMDVINETVTERAKDFDILKWENAKDVYDKKVQAANIQDKATIMLDTAKVNQSNLVMYDYQSQLYDMAGQEAKKASRFKVINAFIGGAADVFGNKTFSEYFTSKTTQKTPYYINQTGIE